MKTASMDNAITNFLEWHADDPDAIKNTEKRIAYSKHWCKQDKWKFMFGTEEVSYLLFYGQLFMTITGSFQWSLYGIFDYQDLSESKNTIKKSKHTNSPVGGTCSANVPRWPLGVCQWLIESEGISQRSPKRCQAAKTNNQIWFQWQELWNMHTRALLGDLPMVQPYVIPAYALTPLSSDLTIRSLPYVIAYVHGIYLTPSISRSSQIAELISEYVPGLMVRYPIGL